jgi:proteasome accessory factor C
MSEAALERVARALNLIPFISSNPGLSVVEIASRFNSTPTQISKDLSLLHMCGLPGYSHLELIDIDFEDPQYVAVRDAQVLGRPRSLSQIELLTLVLGLQMLRELATSENERVAITILQERLSRILNEELLRSISITDAVIASPLFTQISEAISHRQFLHIDYNSVSRDVLSAKKIYPLEIYYHDGIGYLQAFEVDVDQVRTFRVDRIVELTPGEVDMTYASSISPISVDEAAIDIEISMGSDGFFFLEKHNEIVTSFTETPEGYQIRLRVSAGEWIIRTLLTWRSKITVKSPTELAGILQGRIASALANYQ